MINGRYDGDVSDVGTHAAWLPVEIGDVTR
jgi:hypothetical protein